MPPCTGGMLTSRKVGLDRKGCDSGVHHQWEQRKNNKKNPIKDQKVAAGNSLHRNTTFLFSYLHVTSLFSIAF